MPRWNVICSLLATIYCVYASPWFGYPHDHHHHDHHHHDPHCKPPAGPEYDDARPQEYGGPYERNGCSCLLYVGEQLVYRNENITVWHSCSGWGLRRCGRYCDDLFQDDTMRFRSRQNACDTVGTEIYTGWYLRIQVCGEYGPYEDILMDEDLCCRRGRPSDECGEGS